MRNRLILAATLIVLIGGVAGWYWWPRTPPPDPQIARARELQTKLTTDFGKEGKVQEQVKTMTELRDTMGQMSPEQRRKVMTGPGGPASMIRNQAKAYAELPLEKRKNYLDKRIDEMEKFMAAARQTGAFEGGRPGPPGPPTSGDRQERARGMLNNTTPEDRALFSEYFSDLMARRKERGMPGFGGGP